VISEPNDKNYMSQLELEVIDAEVGVLEFENNIINID